MTAPSALLAGFAEELTKLGFAPTTLPAMTPQVASPLMFTAAPTPAPTKSEPLKYYQQRVVNRIQQPDQPGLVVAHGLGTGKTRTAIESAKALNMDAAVVVPASLKGNYEKEVQRWNPSSPNKTEIGSLQGAAASGTMPKDPLLIVDEAHRMRDPGSKTYQAIRTSPAKKRILLTASPFYNHPSDIAPLIDAAAGQDVLPKDREGFNKRYVSTEQVKPGFIDRIRGIHAGEREIVNPRGKGELTKIFKKWVDYHQGTQDDFPTVARQDVKVPMSKEQLHMYDAMLGRAPSWVSRKIKAGLPPDKQEAKQLNAFLGAVRQISNTTRPFQTHGTPSEPKIDAAFGEAKKTLGSNPRAKVVVYSNYIGAGINPYKERLEKEGIPYGEFVGGMKKQDRDELVRKYNTGEIKVLLLSSAGGEGLDLKGTRSIQVLDPHWNWEKIKQVEGRGIRYKSHAGLPLEEQNVTVQRFVSTRPRSGILESLHLRKPGHAVDEYLQQMSYDKERLIDQFKALLPKEEDAPKTASARSLIRPNMMLGFAVELMEKKAEKYESNDERSAVFRGRGSAIGTAAGAALGALIMHKLNKGHGFKHGPVYSKAIGALVGTVPGRLLGMGAGQAAHSLTKKAVSDDWIRDKVLNSKASPDRLRKFKSNNFAEMAHQARHRSDELARMKPIESGLERGLLDTAASDNAYHDAQHKRWLAGAMAEEKINHPEIGVRRLGAKAGKVDSVLHAALRGGAKGLLAGGALGASIALPLLLMKHLGKIKQKQHELMQEKRAVSKEWVTKRTSAGAEKATLPRMAKFIRNMNQGSQRTMGKMDRAYDHAHSAMNDFGASAEENLAKALPLLDEGDHMGHLAKNYSRGAASAAEVGLSRLKKVRNLGLGAGGLGLLGITAVLANRDKDKDEPAKRKWTVKHAAPTSGKLLSEIEEFANVLKKKVPRGTPPHGTPRLPAPHAGVAVPHKPVVYDASGRTYRDTMAAKVRKETEDALAEGLKEAAVRLLRTRQARAGAR